jgi:hypothetical protein
MRVRKSRSIVGAEDVTGVFDGACIAKLVKIAKLPLGADLTPFGEGIKDAARVFAEDARISSNNELHDEIERLYEAATRPSYAEAASLCERLSPRTREWLSNQAERISPKTVGAGNGPRVTAIGRDGQVLTRKSTILPRITLPTPADIRNEALRERSCEIIARLCSFGVGEIIEGRRRPSGRRTRPSRKPLLRAPEKQRTFAKRDAELNFVILLAIAWLRATGKPPPRTARHKDCLRIPGPYARFVGECLRLVGAGYADPVGLINELHNRRRKVEREAERRTGRDVAVAYIALLSRINP